MSEKPLEVSVNVQVVGLSLIPDGVLVSLGGVNPRKRQKVMTGGNLDRPMKVEVEEPPDAVHGVNEPLGVPYGMPGRCSSSP
jgi:hypothetical protein